MAERRGTPPGIPLDRLGGRVAEVYLFDDPAIGGDRVRSPHRHDYHELIWLRSGTAVHLIDGQAVEAPAGSITVIGRGQVHQFQTARQITGGVLRFNAEVLSGGEERIAAGWLLSGQRSRVVAVPPDAVATVEGAFADIDRELAGPADALSADLLRHRVAALVLLVERWYDRGREQGCDLDEADVQLHRRFAQRLEEDFHVHHDAAHYAEALGVPGAGLAQALVRLTGRTTKELIMERVMLEASRLLRFSDLTVGAVAVRVGFADQLYFSRAFKRARGRSPLQYRRAAHGR